MERRKTVYEKFLPGVAMSALACVMSAWAFNAAATGGGGGPGHGGEVRNLFIAATDGFAYLPVDNTVPNLTGADFCDADDPEAICPQSAERKYYIRGFCDDAPDQTAQPGCAVVPAPIIDVNQGDDVFITLRNIDNANPLAPKDPHTIHLHGVHATTQNDGFPESSWEVPETPGSNTGVYYFRAEDPGTYMWHCHVEASEHVQMGMYGAMIIRPRYRSESTVFGGYYGDKYDQEYVVLLSDVELAAHDFIQCGADATLRTCRALGFRQDYNFKNFRADNWTVNGRAFPDTVRRTTTPEEDAACAKTARTADALGFFEGCNPEFSGPPSGFLTGANNLASYAPLVEANLNDRILLRVINLGYDSFPWHIHGWHFRAVGEDARPIRFSNQKEEFTLSIASGKSFSLIIKADDRTNVGQYSSQSNFYGQANEIAVALGTCPGGAPCNESMNGITNDYWFPMHNHEDYKATNDGFYPGGQLSLIHVAPGLVP